MRLFELRKNQHKIGKKSGAKEAVDFLLSIPESDRQNYYVSSSMSQKLGINPLQTATAGTAPIGVYAFTASYFLNIKKDNPDYVNSFDDERFDDTLGSVEFGEGFKYINVFRVDPENVLVLEDVSWEYLEEKVNELIKKYPQNKEEIMQAYNDKKGWYNFGKKLYYVVWNFPKLAKIDVNINSTTNKIFRSIGINSILSINEKAFSYLSNEMGIFTTSIIENRKLFVNSPEHIESYKDSIYPEMLDSDSPHIRSVTPKIALDNVIKFNKKLPGTEIAIGRDPWTAKQYVSRFLIPNGLHWDSQELETKYPTS